MIHYRILDNDQSPLTQPTRSLKVARKHKIEGSKIYAYASRKDALALPLDARLEVKSFVEAHLDARAINPKYPPSSASSRRQMENRFTFRLFGFLDGQAIDAQQFMSVSCKWVRYSCPIFINGKKRTIRALDRGSKAWTSIASH